MANPDDKPATDKPATHKVQGEGDYEAARRYDKNVESFAKSGKVEQAAKDAAPTSETEADALKRAEDEGKSHSKGEGSLTSKRGDAGR